MIKSSWFFVGCGLIAIISALFDRTTPMISEMESNVTEEERREAIPTRRDRWIYGLIGLASLLYGAHGLLH
jgi:hypothetical protein